jgi:hypothetical protein
MDFGSLAPGFLAAGPDAPSVLDGIPFASDFRHWFGASGRKYLTRGFPLDRAADFPGAPVILAAVDEDGRREAVWIGISVGRRFEEAFAAARAAGATEAHVHLVAAGAVARVHVLRDLRGAARGMTRAPDDIDTGAAEGHGRRDLAA